MNFVLLVMVSLPGMMADWTGPTEASWQPLPSFYVFLKNAKAGGNGEFGHHWPQH